MSYYFGLVTVHYELEYGHTMHSAVPELVLVIVRVKYTFNRWL